MRHPPSFSFVILKFTPVFSLGPERYGRIYLFVCFSRYRKRADEQNIPAGENLFLLLGTQYRFCCFVFLIEIK